MAWKDILTNVKSKTDTTGPTMPLGPPGDVVAFPKSFDVLGLLGRQIVQANNDVVICEAEVHRVEMALERAHEQLRELRLAYNQAQDQLGITGVQKV